MSDHAAVPGKANGKTAISYGEQLLLPLGWGDWWFICRSTPSWRRKPPRVVFCQCQQCHQQFCSARNDALYCSQQCRQAAFRERRARERVMDTIAALRRL